MPRTIVHAIESLGVGGGQTLLFELYRGIAKASPTTAQSIVLLNKKKIEPDFVASHKIGYEVCSDLPTYMSTINGERILFFHKLMRSDTSVYKQVRKFCPVICLNVSSSQNDRHYAVHSCDCAVAMHSQMRDSMEKVNPKQRIEVIWNGVDQSRYMDIPAEPRNPQFLYTGRISSFSMLKYPEDWIHWCSRLGLRKPMYHEWLGTGHNYEHARRQKIRWSYGMNKVVLRGLVTSFEKKISILKKWHFFLYGINGTEGISMSLLEAMACGVPVICSNHWGNKEVIRSGVNGHVFDNFGQAEQQLQYYLEHPDAYDKLVKTTVEDFNNRLDARHMVQKYLSLVDEFLGRSNDGEQNVQPSNSVVQ